jgi:hypothetical protein
MSVFTGELLLTELAVNWRVWRLEQDFIYKIDDERSIVVPKGFMTDGASVPSFLWSILPAWASYSRAAVVHDLLCHLINVGKPHPRAPTRKHADDLFHEAMIVCGTGPIVRTLMYIGVRIGSVLPGKNIVDEVNKLPSA